MELILFAIFWILSLFFLLLAKYYTKLLSLDREEFSKSELTGIMNIISSELSGILQDSGGISSLLPFGFAVFLTLLWTWMGGIIGAPHYSSEPGNYFFLSFFIVLVTITFQKGIHEFAVDKISAGVKTSILSRFFEPGKMILFGVSSSLLASGLANYGSYHQIHFFFIFINSIVTVSLFVLYSNDRYPQKFIYPFVENTAFYDENDVNIPDFNDLDEDFSDEEFKV